MNLQDGAKSATETFSAKALDEKLLKEPNKVKILVGV